jgi:glucuronate isomerase
VTILARRLYANVRDLPIISPHGHADPRWFAEDEPFPDPAQLFVVPDHDIYRMLYSQGIPLASAVCLRIIAPGLQRVDIAASQGAN